MHYPRDKAGRSPYLTRDNTVTSQSFAYIQPLYVADFLNLATVAA